MPSAVKKLTKAVVKDEVANFRIMLVGNLDTGKTTIAASAAKHEDMSPVLFLDVDGRLTTLPEVDNIYKMDINTIKDIEAAKVLLAKPKKFWDEEIREVKTIVIDSISRLKDNVLDEVAQRDKDIKAGRNRTRDDVYMYTQRDYGTMTNIINNLIKVVVQTNLHVIIVCHNRDIMTEKVSGHSNVPKLILDTIEPELNNKLRINTMAYMHHVWYTRKGFNQETGELRYELLTLPDMKRHVKVTNAKFINKLVEMTTKGMTGKKREFNMGWLSVPYSVDSLPNTMAMLWDAYKECVNERIA